jgi:hypothetical protein
MLIRAVSTATLLGAPHLVPVTLPVLILAAVLFFLVPLSMVFWSILKNDGTQARLRLGQWYEFSLDSRNCARKTPRDSGNALASKDDEPASKP